MTDFDARSYRFWFVTAVDRIGFGWLAGAVILGLVPYVLGLILVTPFGELGLYLRTPAFYMGFAGVTLVLAASVRGVEILSEGLSQLQEVAVSPAAFRSYVDTRLRQAARARSNAFWLIPFAVGAVVLLAETLHRWHRTGVVSPGHQFHAFLVEWRASDALVPAGLAIGAFAVAVVVATGGSIILLIRNLFFVWGLRKFEYLPFPGRIRLNIRTLITAYVWVSGTWAIGVALFAFFFFRQWSGLSAIGIALLAAIGVLTLLVPYATFRKILDDSHETMAMQLATGVKLGSGGVIAHAAAPQFAAINAAIIADPPPVLTRRSAFAYGFVQLVAVGSLFAKTVLQEQVAFLARTPAPPASAEHRPARR